MTNPKKYTILRDTEDIEALRIALPEIAEEIKDYLPAQTSQLVVIERSGHYPWIDESDRYFETVSAFLDGNHHAQKP